MTNYKQLFMDHMDRQGVKYTEEKENILCVSFGGKNLKAIPIYVFFDENGAGLVQLACWKITSFKDKFAPGILTCNQLNAKYRWVKYYLDNDMEVRCTLDARIDEATCGAECLELLLRMVNIIDESYPAFMKALWTD